MEASSIPALDEFGAKPGAALVIGGTGGLGSAIARMLAHRGSDVAITYRGNRSCARSLVSEMKQLARQAHAWQLDVSRARAASRVVAAVAARFGAIHTVVYAAGPDMVMDYVSRIDPQRFLLHLQSEASGFYNIAHVSIPHLRETRGSLTAVSSVATSRVFPRDILSAGPKAAIDTVARFIAVEEGRYGMRANVVGVGATRDGLAAKLIQSGDLDERAMEVARTNMPLRRFGTANDVAEAVCFLASDRASFITGQTLNVDGGFSA